MKVILVLPRRRLWRWHALLIEALAVRADLHVRLEPGAPYPLATRAWLALERRLFGDRGQVSPFGPKALGPKALGEPARTSAPPAAGDDDCDVLIDLAGSARAGGTRRLSLHFDGRAEEAALFAALQARRSPQLEVVEEGRGVVAASQAAIEVRDELGRSLGYVHARLLAMILRALDGEASPASPPPPADGAAGADLAQFVRHALGRKLKAKLSRGRSVEEHWRIALRRVLPDAGDGPPSKDGFLVEAGPAAAFHADPFLFAREGQTFLFVEAFPWSDRKGVIACATLNAQGAPGDFETVLEADHHLSYPQVFAHAGEIYMLPETASMRRLELYRATDFPRGWTRAAVMLEGLRIADATLLQQGDRWWLFASLASPGGASQDELHGWHGPSPFGPWTAHARNPLVSDVRAGRPAGRFVRRGGRLYRPAQDSEAGYGAGLAWCEVLELTPERYREAVVARWRGADFGPFTGVHTFSEAGGYEAIDVKTPR